ncbi:MAG: biopolymer transporter ExbD [Deltaproteobacteria bacterium]
MASTTSHSDEAITGINVTPLVDITLVLLIIFMVTAKLIAGQSVPLDLPKAATAGATQSVFTVAVDADAHVSANGRPVADRAALQGEAKKALASDSGLRVLVSASTRSSHGSVMQVVDSLRQVGVSRIAFAADPGEPSPNFGE